MSLLPFLGGKKAKTFWYLERDNIIIDGFCLFGFANHVFGRRGLPDVFIFPDCCLNLPILMEPFFLFLWGGGETWTTRRKRFIVMFDLEFYTMVL